MNARSTLLAARGIRKRFPGVTALDGVDFDVRRGEIHCLLGGNGAGKSTLVKILAGAYQADEGTVTLDGETLLSKNPRDSRKRGIATVYQELSLVPDLTVAQNVFLGRESTALAKLLLNRRELKRRSSEVLSRLGITIDVDARVHQLSVAERQLVEIARALSEQAKLVVFDEPTSALTSGEREKLFSVIRELAALGVGIVFISHRLEEVHLIGERVTVFRDGRRIGTYDVDAVTLRALVAAMAGRDIEVLYPRAAQEPQDPALEVQGLTRHGRYHDVTFSVRAGEVLGLYGVIGSGRGDVLMSIFGARPHDLGVIKVRGRELRRLSVRKAMAAGLAFVPPDRKTQGLVLPLSVAENIALPTASARSRAGVLSTRARRRLAIDYIQRLKIVPPRPEHPTRLLSGGNQQKIVVAKGLSTDARVFLFDEPTLGMDVNAKVDLYNLVNDITADGGAVVWSSSDADEVVGMSDRIVVFHEGRIVDEFDAAESDHASLVSAAFGVALSSSAEATSDVREAT